MLWDLNEGKHLYTLEAGCNINTLTFSPNRYWLCAASGPSIKIWVSFHYCHLMLFINFIQYCLLKNQLPCFSPFEQL